MLVLGVDCSSKQGSVALTKDGRPLYQCVYDSNMTHSQNLLSLVDNAVSVCGIKKEDIDLFAVTLGPGSFTGLRIGIALIKGMDSGEALFVCLAEASDQRLFEIVAGRVFLKGKIDRQTIRHVNMGQYAAHVPCMPALDIIPFHLSVIHVKPPLSGHYLLNQGFMKPAAAA